MTLRELIPNMLVRHEVLELISIIAERCSDDWMKRELNCFLAARKETSFIEVMEIVADHVATHEEDYEEDSE